MNLISSIIIKDNDIKNNSIDNNKLNSKHDHGFNLYQKLEFNKNQSKEASLNLQLEALRSRLL